MKPTEDRNLCGMMGEYGSPAELLAAARRARDAGWRKMDACSPFPIEGLHEIVGPRWTILPFLVLSGGLGAGSLGFIYFWWTATVLYPLNVGGRPLHSWTPFIVETFESIILGAAVTAVVSMLFLNGLPQPYHPAFNVPEFARASSDGFFLILDASDRKFRPDAARRLLVESGAREVFDVEH
jgi:hypothetical protein